MKKNKKTYIPELLAPAGSLSAGLAAFDSGADAVYAGLSKFNARERTENFTFEDMSKLVAYSQKIGKKVYITLNTLIKESELPDLLEYVSEIAKLEPNAVIIQDLGVLNILKNYFPNLEVHASTQMGIHNSAGANFAAKLGFKRVILERQITLKEIEEIKKNSRIQTEVFIHGALCCSMSGNCLLSSWLGGWSGNRGKCKQPCRRRYFSDSGNGFFLSTKDLCSIDIIQDYKKIGVNSLKIEGRLKKADYVKSVVSAYRMILDAHPDESSVKLIKQARDVLGRSLGRKWTSGFRDEESFKDVIEYKKLGASGKPCGFVVSIKKSGFNAKMHNKIHIGDRIRVQPKTGGEGPTFHVTKIFVENKSVFKVAKGQQCFIACDRDIPSDATIYKVGESGGDFESRIKQLPILTKRVDLKISISNSEISVKSTNINLETSWTKSLDLQEAKKNPLDKTTIYEAFKANNSDRFNLVKTDINIGGNLFLPASLLKESKREFWEWFSNRVTDFDLNSHIYESMERFRINYQKESKSISSDDTSVQIGVTNKKITLGKDDLIVHTLDDFDLTTQEVILPDYCFESYLPVVKRKIRKAVSKGKKRFRVTSLYQLELLRDFNGLELSTSYPLPVTNSLAALEVKHTAAKLKAKLNHVQAWVELEKEELFNLIRKSEIPVEIYRYGRLHLLVTRAHMPVKGKITDSKGNNFFVVLDSDSGLVTLYADKVFSIPKVDGVSEFYDLSLAEKNEKECSSFNFEHSML